MARIRRLTGGRAWAARLSVLVAVGAIVGLIVAVFPAQAGAGLPSDKATPTQLNWGGGSGACDFIKTVPGVDPTSVGQYELHINNPSDTTFAGPLGASVKLSGLAASRDEIVNFVFSGGGVSHAIVNGGKKSTLWDYTPGAETFDNGLHAPTKGNSPTGNLFSVSHTTFCFDDLGFIEGIKNLDSAADGTGDSGLGGWTIRLLDKFGDPLDSILTSSQAGSEGEYSFAVPPGDYFVCEDLEASGDTTWHQSAPTNEVATDGGKCGTTNGYSVAVQAGLISPVAEFANFETAAVSGVKFHDSDTNGVNDSNNDPLSGWTIKAFQSDGSAIPGASNATIDPTSDPTGASGSYTLTLLTGHDYVICEVTNSQGLPGAGFVWGQSELDDPQDPLAYPTWGAANEDCDFDGEGVELAGHSLPDLYRNEPGIDFGNHWAYSYQCNNTPETATISQVGVDPGSTVTITCNKQTGFVAPFDVGTDFGGFDQFVTFGGDPGGTEEFDQTIIWAPEQAEYTGNPPVLQVPTTLVRLQGGGDPVPVELCNRLPNNEPNSTTPDCLDSRTIAEGGTLPIGTIQLTEYYRFLGDPPRFR